MRFCFRSRKASSFKIGLLVFSAIAIFSRAPQLIRHPIFWAEEGARYFHYALENGLWPTLIYLDPRAGYLDFTRHLSAGLAASVPLVYAPHITTLIAFLIQLLPCFIIIYGRSNMFESYSRKLVGCLIVVFAPSVIDEIWLNTINSMTWYGLIGFLISIDRLHLIRRIQVVSYRVILAIGSVSGPYVCMLAPLFGWNAFREKTRDTAINAGIVGTGVIIHGAVLWHFTQSGMLNEKRFSGLELSDVVYGIFWDHVVIPVLSFQLLTIIGRVPYGLSAILVISSILLIAILWYASNKDFNIWQTNWPIMVSWFLFSFGTTLTSFNHSSSGRYGVLPGWMILFLLLNCSRLIRLKLIGVVSLVALSVAIGIGLIRYPLEGRTLCDGRSWASSIEQIASHGIYVLPICPTGWEIDLKNVKLDL